MRAFHHTYGLPTLTTNCSNNYGPYQFPEKLIPLMIHKALDGEKLPVYGDGRNVRDWLYRRRSRPRDPRVLEIGRTGEVYNVGGDAERENIDVVKTICALLDERRPLAGRRQARVADHVTSRTVPATTAATRSTRARSRRELGWRQTESFETGIAKTVDWYLRRMVRACSMAATRRAAGSTRKSDRIASAKPASALDP